MRALFVVLKMLDLPAAFDSIDHQILLSRLHDMYGIKGMHIIGSIHTCLTELNELTKVVFCQIQRD